MQESKKEIEVWLGNKFVTVVPKSSEKEVRLQYYGTPEEKKLMIKPHIPVTQEDLNKIVSDVKTELNKKLIPN